MGLPACAPRSLGLRHGFPAAACDTAARWKAIAGGDSRKQDRIVIRAQPRHRRTGFSGGRARRAAKRRAGGDGIADTALSRGSATARAATTCLERNLGTDA